MPDNDRAEQCLDELSSLLRVTDIGPWEKQEAAEIIQRHLDAVVNEGKSMQVHNLKTWSDAFTRIWDGVKRHEYRRNDRRFAVGDELVLKEYDPEANVYSGRSVRVTIVDLDVGPAWGIPNDFCVMTISAPYDRQG